MYIHCVQGVSVVESPSQDPHGFLKKTPSVLMPDIEKPEVDDKSSFDYIDDTENSTFDYMTPMTYIENVNKLQKSPEHQNIRDFFEQKMTKLLLDWTQKDLEVQAESYECPGVTDLDNCPCVQRIDIVMETYSKLMNNDDLWLCVPLAPVFTLDGRYAHQQLHDDFIHIKMYHIGRDFYRHHKGVSDEKDQDQEEEKEAKSRKKTADMLGMSETEQKEVELADSENIGKVLYERYANNKLCRCPDFAICKGFKRHYRQRGNGAAEDLLFHTYDDNSVGAKTRKMRNNKERTLQEECDKIHSYFLHSTIQFGGSGRLDENDPEVKRITDLITANAQGRSYSKPEEKKVDDSQKDYVGKKGMCCPNYSFYSFYSFYSIYYLYSLYSHCKHIFVHCDQRMRTGFRT